MIDQQSDDMRRALVRIYEAMRSRKDIRLGPVMSPEDLTAYPWVMADAFEILADQPDLDLASPTLSVDNLECIESDLSCAISSVRDAIREATRAKKRRAA